MNQLIDALQWLGDAGRWTGEGGIPHRIGQHLLLSIAAVAAAGAIALPAGVIIGHTRRGVGLVGAVTGAARAVPTLGLLTVFGLLLGIGPTAPLLALVVLAVPSLLAGAYAGVQAVDPQVPAAAAAIGMTPRQVIASVELPLALPTIIGGVRTAFLQVVATATLAAYTSDIGLGRYLFHGLKTRDYTEMLGGAIVVVALALFFEALFALLQRAALRRPH